MRPVFAIPGYLILGLAGLSSLLLVRKVRPLPSLLCLASSALFFTYILWRAYHSPVEYLSRPDRYMVLACLIVYLIFALYITDPKTRLYFFYGLFLIGTAHIILGAIQYSKENNFLPFGYLRADYGRRASGFYVCPNHYAGLLEMLIVMAAAIGVWARVGLKTRMVVLYFSMMALGGLALSGSRGGYLSIAVGVLTLATISVLVVHAVRPEKTLVIACAAICLVGFGGVAGVSLMKRSVMLSARVNNINEKSNMRLHLWDAAKKQYQSEPVMGTGAGTYYYLGRFYRDPAVPTDPIWVHNDYYHLLAEYGRVGALGCGIFLLCHLGNVIAGIRRIIKNRLSDRSSVNSSALALNLGALSGIAALLAHSVVDFNAHIPGNALILAALFGILSNPPTFRVKQTEPRIGPTLPFRILIPSCAVILVTDAAPHLLGEWHSEKARVALRDRHYLSAMREAQLGLEAEKTNPDLHYYLGEARRLLGNGWSNQVARDKMNEAALMAFTNSIKLFPQDEKVWVKMSQALDMMGRHDEAFAHLENALELDPNLSALNTYFAAHYQIMGEDKKALEYYKKAEQFELARKSQSQLLLEIKSDGAR